MKNIIIFFIWLLGAFGLIVLASIMAFKEVNGWGWFLIVGFLCLTAVSYKDDEDDINKGGK